MFTEKFCKFIQDNKISAYRIAKDTQISQGLMNNYKNGIKIPSLDNLVKIADYLGVSVDYLLDRTDKKKIGSQLNEHEEVLIEAYRSQPDFQKAVDRLLGVQPEDKNER